MGAAFAHSLDSGIDWYWAGTDWAGTIWCAGNRATINESTSNVAQVDGFAYAKRDVYCANPAPAPSGYIRADVRLLKAGALCRDWDGFADNPSNGYVAHDIEFLVTCGGNASYTAQTFSAVALIFDWRYDVTDSPSHAF